MAFIANTMFEVSVSNSVRNQTQHVAGKFGTNTGSSFTAADCSAGLLCVQNGLIPCEGYEAFNLLNGNTWYFNAATNGTVGGIGDHTGIYAFNNYDVEKAVNGENQWNLGVKTLGLGLPAGNIGDFCEIIIGEQYSFGLGNFATGSQPGSSVVSGYATISAGLLAYSSTKPDDGSGVYFQILRRENVNEGASYWGNKYVCKAFRAPAATASPTL